MPRPLAVAPVSRGRVCHPVRNSVKIYAYRTHALEINGTQSQNDGPVVSDRTEPTLASPQNDSLEQRNAMKMNFGSLSHRARFGESRKSKALCCIRNYDITRLCAIPKDDDLCRKCFRIVSFVDSHAL